MPERTTLSVKDFGPIAEATIDLRPLTEFVGASSTGKSYLAILLYALHRFFAISRGRTRLSSSVPDGMPLRVRYVSDLQWRRTIAMQALTSFPFELADLLPDDALFVVQRKDRETQVASFKTWGSLRRKPDISKALDDGYEPLPVSDRILRGDFDA